MAYSTDTRTFQPGDVYVAIVGETHDGHDFVPQAVEKGAAGVVVERGVSVPETVDVRVVENATDWLVDKASAKLADAGCDVVAITGSVGKTTTRTAVVAVLDEAFRVQGSEGNKNTPLGLSLMLLNADLTPETKLVLEMGARLPGDIRDLCAAFRPTVGVVTNVRGVHLETLGSLDGVEREKSEIVRALPAAGTAVLNGDDERARRMADVTDAAVVLYGSADGCDVTPADVTAELPILGDHAVYTAMIATAVGRAFGMDDATIARGLEAIVPEKGRLRALDGIGGSTLVDDTYNASPDAVVAALDVVAGLGGERTTAFLGDMLELGEPEHDEHVRVLRAALETVDRVVAVGERMKKAAAALADGERQRVETAESSRAVAGAIESGGPFPFGPGDVVLVKGSQGARMERVSEALLAPELDARDVLPRQTEQWKAID